MADSRQWRFRLWPWRQQTASVAEIISPPTAEEVAEKLTELVQFERGVVALYYYLRDETLATLAQSLCQSHQTSNRCEPGVDRDLRTLEAAPESWRAVSAISHSEVWQPGEILPTFGFRVIEALRAQPELWSLVVDPRAQCFGLAATKDETHRYWFVLVIGQKGQEMGSDTTTAAR
jgi:hypothetical protein